MSASRNAEAVSGQPGQFGSHVPRDEPMSEPKHKPGVLVGNDTVPEFHAKTLPPGSAPADRTFTPNTSSMVPGQADNSSVERDHGKESTKTTASSTLGGATSADVHTGMGHPGQGQTSNELRHGKNNSKKGGGGLAGVGASVESSNQMVDTDTQPKERAIDKEEGKFAGTRGNKGEDYPQPPAQEREPESAEDL
ncbi:MAG: hypothetical protein ASARMPREDX12_007048 [Alectoria sarmentosa]|nr:MAG: hypothetical protein ASARMPREDX12_007048 [Alectoria sarmentosa]CAD6578266.1 MAG: hypothetical protein ASARMPRED_008664 [Alectoria sarmentosa]